MREPTGNWWSDAFNAPVNWLANVSGYSTDRRGVQGDGNATGSAAGDNSFYRDNASMMPGWGNTFGLGFMDPNGLPSGATAQDRATNYVGQNDPTGVWGDVRQNLVTNESASIAAARARGDTNISFGDVYDGHVSAYSDAQAAGRARDPSSTAGNPFVDPASFALAMYGAPLLEHAGINTGPMTGLSIDWFNDPTDSVGDGWAKRMALAGGEMGVGAGALGAGLLTGNPLLMAGGVAGIGLGAYTGVANTISAVRNGMGVGDALSGVGHLASDVGGALWDGAGSLANSAGSAISSGASSVASGAADLWNSIW